MFFAAYRGGSVVNHLLLNQEEMREIRRTGKSGWQEKPRWLHRHAPSVELHQSPYHGKNSILTLSRFWHASS